MGYFDNLAQAAQPARTPPAPAPQEPKTVPAPAPQPAQIPTKPAAPLAAKESEAVPDAAIPAADLVADQAQSGAEPPVPGALPLESSTPETADVARREHEAAEARRKAEWEAKQREKKAAEQVRLNRLAAMSDEEVVAASTHRVSADTEKLTRRSMKDCVSEHIQAMCRQDPAFARKAMHPRKSMVHCFWYINRIAKEYIQKEMKANGVQPENGIYGDDVPDDLVYQWAVDYFNDPDVQEDKEKEEKFIPRPYTGKSSKASKTTAKTKSAAEAKKGPAPKPQSGSNFNGQLSFMEVAG